METTSALFDLATVALACRDQSTLLKTLAARIGPALGARGALIWIAKENGETLVCRNRWAEAGERFDPAEATLEEGLLADIFRSASQSGARRRLAGREIDEHAFLHLEEGCRARVKCALYAPIPGVHGPAGIVEVLNKRTGEFTAEDAHFLEEAGRVGGQALTNLAGIEGERRTHLATLERLTALYDLGRTFTSTLELAELLPIVAGKIREIVNAGACNLWLIDSNSHDFYLAQRCGEDPTVDEGARASLSEGLFAEIAQQANPKLVAEPGEEPALEERRKARGDFEIQSWMAAPLRKQDEVLGVVELLNKTDGTAFDEDDLFFLASISEQAAVALHNARLLESERKLHALGALLKISQGITSTLDLDHVLHTVVHQAAAVVPFDRCAIGFYDRGRFLLGAVSGETEVPKSREMEDLREQLEWVAEKRDPVSANKQVDAGTGQPDEADSQLAAFLEAYGYEDAYALPLRDEQGSLGAIAFLSVQSDFLSENNKEIVAILTSQTTVAIRNAQLYQQVPLANFLQPLAARKKKLLAAMPQGRWRDYAERAGIAALLLTLVPWPMRLGTDATVIPAGRRIVSALAGGVVRRVLVHEGDVVQSGQSLAELDDGEDRVKLAQAEAALAQARRDVAGAEFRNDSSVAAAAKILADLHAAEVAFEQDRISAAQLRAPISGIVVTPKVDEKVGAMVRPGETFCEIFPQDRMAAEISVAETDLGLVRVGKDVALKLNALPTTTFRGTVERIGEQMKVDAGEQYYLTRAVFENPSGRARQGMVGRARISTGGGWFQTGWYPVGYVILRTPFRWSWEKLWSWLP